MLDKVNLNANTLIKELGLECDMDKAVKKGFEDVEDYVNDQVLRLDREDTASANVEMKIQLKNYEPFVRKVDKLISKHI